MTGQWTTDKRTLSARLTVTFVGFSIDRLASRMYKNTSVTHIMLRFLTAIAIMASLSLDLFPLSDSNSDAPFTTIEASLLLKWVLYPIVSNIAIAKWKHSHRQ